MKKELLMTSLILLNPISTLQAQEIKEFKSQIISKYVSLSNMVFETEESYSGTYWSYETGKDVTSKYKLKLSFISHNETEDIYQGNGNYLAESMEYSVIVTREYEDGESRDLGYEFRVDQHDNNTFKLYNCDTTISCSDTNNSSFFKLEKSNQQLTITVNDQDSVFFQDGAGKTFSRINN